MQFPFGLSARLMRRRLLGAFRDQLRPAIFHLSPFVRHFPEGARLEAVSPETEWHTPEACVKAAEQAGAPVVWLGGAEPLFHPQIGEVALALAGAGHYVFLPTSGVGLRKRIHEFKPVSRLYLCLEAPVGGTSPASQESAACLDTVAEALRVSRLSGFHVCAHLQPHDGASPSSLRARLQALQAMHVEGVVASSGRSCTSRRDRATAALVAGALQLIPGRGWRAFSRLLEASYQAEESAASYEPSQTRTQTGACEETA